MKIPAISSMLGLLGCLAGRLISCGSSYSLGVYYKEIQSSLKTTHFQTSMLFSIDIGLLLMTGLVIPSLLKKFTERQLVVVGGLLSGIGVLISAFTTNYYLFACGFSILNGIGQGLAFVTIPVAGSFLFPSRYHHIVVALLCSGDGLGMFLFPFTFETLIQVFTWRGSLIIFSGVLFNLCVCGAVLHPPTIRHYKNVELPEQGNHDQNPSESGFYSHSSKNSVVELGIQKKSQVSMLVEFCNLSLCWDIRFLCLMATSFFSQLAINIFYTFAIVHFISRGLSSIQAAWVIMTLGLSLLALTIYRGPFSGFIVAAIGAGLGSGAIGSLVCCVGLDVMGPAKLSETFSFMMTAWGLGSMVGAALAGVLRDAFNSYVVPLGFGTAALFFSGLVLLPLAWLPKSYEDIAENSDNINDLDENIDFEDDTLSPIKPVQRLGNFSSEAAIKNVSMPHLCGVTHAKSITERIYGSMMGVYAMPLVYSSGNILTSRNFIFSTNATPGMTEEGYPSIGDGSTSRRKLRLNSASLPHLAIPS